MKSSVGLWTAALKPGVLHCGRRHLGFLEPEVTIFRRKGGALEDAHLLHLNPDCI